MNYAYLSPRALKGLQQYQYKPGGYTWLDDLHQPFWNGAVEYFPRWLAPNLITLVGLIALVVAYLVSGYYYPSLEGEGPRWVYFLSGFAALFYMHLDCLDGKQARRTKSSSPLGQLFDHGCDALSVHLLLITVAVSLQVGINWKSVAGQIMVMGPWLAAHWEEYHTGIMLYGNGYFGVLEANYMLVFLHVLTTITGPGIWQVRLAALFPASVAAYLPAQLGLNDVLLLGFAGCSVFQISGPVVRVLTTRLPDQLAVAERGAKQIGRGAAAWQAIQLAAFLVLGYMCMWEPIRRGDSVLEVRLVYAAFGIAYALEASKLIMAHMAKEPYRVMLWPIGLLCGHLLASRLDLLPGAALAWGLASIIAAGYLHWVFLTVDQICRFLDINCLTIKHTNGQHGH